MGLTGNRAFRALRERHAPLHHVPIARCIAVSIVVLMVVVVLAIGIGSVSVPPWEAWNIVLGRVIGHQLSSDLVTDQILWEYRVPRVLLAALCGAGLSVAGVVLQALVANPLADPYVLGVSSGGSFGAVLVMTLGGAALGGLGVSAAAFVGAMAAAMLVFALGQRGGRVAPTRLVLSGVAVGYVFSALTSYTQLQANPNQLRAVLFWLLGSVAGAQWEQLRVVTVVVVLMTAILILFSRRLNALVVGDEPAASLGVDVHRLRMGLLGVASLLIGTLIAVAGGIGFVGLMIPHLVRLTVGTDHRRVLPLAALVGASYLVVVDLLSRTVNSPNEIPLGIFTAGFGAPFFLWLLRRNSTVGES